jgi:hypothetical protein
VVLPYSSAVFTSVTCEASRAFTPVGVAFAPRAVKRPFEGWAGFALCRPQAASTFEATSKVLKITVHHMTCPLIPLQTRLVLYFDRKSRLLPCIETAVQRMYIRPTVIREHLRHTGARRLVRSSTVGDDRAVTRNVIEMLFHLVGGDADRARQFRASFSPCCRIACVEKGELLTAIQTLFYLIYSDPRWFHDLCSSSSLLFSLLVPVGATQTRALHRRARALTSTRRINAVYPDIYAMSTAL